MSNIKKLIHYVEETYSYNYSVCLLADEARKEYEKILEKGQPNE